MEKENSMSVRLGIDVGGTFTDLVAMESSSGRLYCSKVPTTPDDPIAGVVGAIKAAAINYSDIESFIYGTTVATNALLERNGALTGFVCTKGFRDIIYIQRMNRKHHYDLSWDKPKLPVLRQDCFEVEGRFDVEGNELRPLDIEGAKEVAEKIKARGLEAIAICFLCSYKNGSHEIKMRDIIKEICPDVEITMSHEVYPRWREYERASTSIVDAYLKPLVSNYVQSVSKGLLEEGMNAKLLLSKSNGGVTEASAIVRKPVDLILSGPVGGVLAATQIGAMTNRGNLISADMGGTSFDVSMIIDGNYGRSQGIELEWGLPIRSGMVSVETIGTGGGSIARIDNGGFLRVGPQSAGAWPGPACYGRGGDLPTVSDANLMLGRLNPENFAGGTFKLQEEKAKEVISKLAKELKSDPFKVANDIVDLSNWNMVNAIRLASIEKGRDPRDFSLVAFGGAGSAHAGAIFDTMGMKEAIIPVNQGVLSAFGLTTADMRVDVSQTTNMRSDILDLEEINRITLGLIEKALRNIREDGFRDEPVTIVTFEMRYLGQNHGLEINVFVKPEGIDGAGLKTALKDFHTRHKNLYGYNILDEIIEITDFNVTALGAIPKPALPKINAAGALREVASRSVYFTELGGFKSCKVFNRADICADSIIEGPAIIEEDHSLTVLHPKKVMTADEWGNLYMSRI